MSTESAINALDPVLMLKAGAQIPSLFLNDQLDQLQL